jgi:hypothetical protein
MSDEKKVETFIPEDNKFTLTNGEVLEVKPLNWGKEIKVCQLVSKFFGDNNMIDVFTLIAGTEDGKENSLEAISGLIIPLINEAPQVITKILALMLDKEPTYIEESLTSEDVMQIFVPFLQSLFTKYTKMFQKINLK